MQRPTLALWLLPPHRLATLPQLSAVQSSTADDSTERRAGAQPPAIRALVWTFHKRRRLAVPRRRRERCGARCARQALLRLSRSASDNSRCGQYQSHGTARRALAPRSSRSLALRIHCGERARAPTDYVALHRETVHRSTGRRGRIGLFRRFSGVYTIN